MRLGASMVSMDSLECVLVGRLSELELRLPRADSLEELFLDLNTSLSRPTGEGDLLLDCDTGGASPEACVDPEGSGSPKLSVV